MPTLFFASRYHRLQDIESESHCHADIWQVEYCLSDHLVTYTADNITHPLTRGSIIAIPPGFTHCQTLPSGTETNLIKFSHSACRLTRPVSMLLHGEERVMIENIMAALIYEHDGREQNRQHMITSLLEQLLLWLERWSRMARPAPDCSAPANARERVRQTGDLLRRNYRHSFSVKELAAGACLSRSRFLEIFREEFEVSPIAFHTRVRMEKAVELARYTGMSWQQIARQLGYEDAGYFSRVFRRCMGICPSQYDLSG